MLGKILVVEDSRVMRRLVSMLLSCYAETVIGADSVAEAMAAIARSPDLDLVVCDVWLPDGDGFQVAERVVREDGDTTPVILITARWCPEVAERAVKAGAIGCLAKPVSLQDIRDCLETHPRRVAPAAAR